MKKLYAIWSAILTWFGDLYLATSPPKIKAKDLRAMLSLVEAGDILLRRYKSYLDGYFIPGRYSHSSIVVDKNSVVHAAAESVEKIDILDFCLHTDGFCILRPKYLNSNFAEQVVRTAINLVGRPYDFAFNSYDTSALYCHELTNTSLSAVGLSVSPKRRKVALFVHRNVIIADDFLNNFDIVYETDVKRIRKAL
jgi:uncharacterized protein YycO